VNRRRVFNLIGYINLPLMIVLSYLNSNNIANCIRTYNYCVFDCNINLLLILFMFSLITFLVTWIDLLFNWGENCA